MEGHSSSKEQTGGTGNESTKGDQCTYIFCRAAHTAALNDYLLVVRVTIDMLPDVALLRVFDLYMDEDQIEAWQMLVHVCREWRDLVFGSPRRLDLRLLCTDSTTVREMLDVWPLLPIVVRAKRLRSSKLDNVIAALEQSNRICQLELYLPLQSSDQEQILAAMQRPFPALTNLQLHWFFRGHQIIWVDPESFLGGFAPNLRTLVLDSIQFPVSPKLLLSATHLVDLHLRRNFLSPEDMLPAFSALTRLKKLNIESSSNTVRKSLRPPQPTRTLLPVLTKFQFKGFDEYLEDLVARVDAPLLDHLDITFLDKPTSDYPQLIQLISRTPKFKAQDRARVVFDDYDVWVTLSQTFNGRLSLRLSDNSSDWQLWSLAPVCKTSFPRSLILAVEYLYLFGPSLECVRYNPWGNREWLKIFHPFAAVKSLYISYSFAPTIAYSLEELIGERVGEVLPALETLFIEESYLLEKEIKEAIGRFIAARQLAGRTIAVCRWEDVKDVWKDEFGDTYPYLDCF